MKSVSPSVRRARLVRRPARLLTLGLSLLVVLATIPFVTHGQSDAAPSPPDLPPARTPFNGKTHTEFVPGHVLVRFRDNTAALRAERNLTSIAPGEGAAQPARVTRFGGSDIVGGLRLVEVAPEATFSTISALRARADVLYAEPDYIRHKSDVPNDPRFPQMYGLNNTGQTGGTPGSDIGAVSAWGVTHGSSDVVVGVVDEGIDINHPDLQANIWTNPGDDADAGFPGDAHGWDFVHNDNTVFDDTAGTYPPPAGYTGDVDDHGTHVAGTIGAVGNNGQGVVGVNWNARLLSIKVLGVNGGADSDIIRGLSYAKLLRDRWESSGHTRGANIRVLNNSYGGGGFSQSTLDAINALNSSGILFVVAAGNDASSNDALPTYPASFTAPNVVAVAATTNTDALASFSNFGAKSVALGAPGSGIISTTPFNTYSTFSGTSMATPHVTGAAALICAAYPNITVKQLHNVLLYSGDVVTSTTGRTYSNRRLNVAKALQSLAENDTTPPGAITALQYSEIGGPTSGRRQINVSWQGTGDDGATGTPALYEINLQDTNTGTTTLLQTVVPDPNTQVYTRTVTLPYKHPYGLLKVRAIDNVGNIGQEAAAVVMRNPAVDDPYVPTLGAAQPLSTGGTPLGLQADDRYLLNYSLPFSFPFYQQGSTSVVSQTFTTVNISTNGSLYVGPVTPPTRSTGDADDAGGSVPQLSTQMMIAGLWDDLRTDRPGCDVFVTTASDHIIFRWQAVTFGILPDGTPRGENPVNFEIELRNDGTVVTRYGSGNTNLTPVVGLSGGEPDAYVIDADTRPFGDPRGLLSLTNAATVTYTPRSSTTPTVQFSTSAASVHEQDESVTLTVTRTGDLSQPATVGYHTIDDPAPVRCDDQINNHGAAYARCDYATTVGTLSYAAGEATKSFSIPVIDDGQFENPETFQVALYNPSPGLALNTPAITTVTILDNDSATTPNPIFTTSFFVRQHYLDFLSREPDTSGFNAWSNLLNNCSDVNNNPSCDRLTVSQSFFQSQEFQLKGFFVFRFYKLAFNRLPDYTEIIPDMSSVTGSTSAEVFQKKAAFASAFAQRADFSATYDALANNAYVTTLLNRYGLNSITTPDPAAPDGTTKVTLTANDLTTQLSAGTLTRAQVLRAVADSDQVGAAEFNPGFVAMQYYGYLRRTPETGGYQAWLNYLNAHPTDSRTMVNGFVNSIEYRIRFGPQ
jgi:subtilisin family serine protease